MTLKQLLSETYALGFEDEEEVTSSFIFATNRALRTINIELGDEKNGIIDIKEDTEKSLLPGGMAEYKITDFIPDFLLATKVPLDDKCKTPDGSSIIGASLTLPLSFTGRIFIRYKPYCEMVTGDDLEHMLPIAKRCEHLLGILTASYVWLDDDAEKASYYMQIYKEESARMKYELRQCIENAYIDTTGWS